MLAALTVLPALLSRFGERIARRRAGGGRARRLGRAVRSEPAVSSEPAPAGEPAGGPGFWVRWAVVIERHPWPGAIVGLAIMLLLASPALALRLGNSDAGNNPPARPRARPTTCSPRASARGSTARCRWWPRYRRPNDAQALASIARDAARDARRRLVSPRRGSAPSGLTAVFNVYPRSAPQALATTRTRAARCAGARCRRWRRGTGTTLLVGGTNAITIDFTHVLSSKLPLFIGIVVLLSALLLLRRLPIARDPAAGGAHEPALDRRLARRRRRDLPVGLARRHLQRRRARRSRRSSR